MGRLAGCQRVSAHKSGRRPRGRSPWHCRRPSVGNRRLYAWTPLPPTHLVLTSYLPPPDSGSLPTHDYRCSLQCILRVVFKKHRFLQGFVAFAVSRISSWRRSKTMGFSWFWVLGRGPERKTRHLDGLGANIGPTSAKLWATWVNIRLR